MRKLISLVLVLCMACMLVPAMADDDISGEWYGGVQGQPLILSLNADGSYTMSLMESDASSGTWVLDDPTLTMHDTEGDYDIVMVYRDSALNFDEMGITLTKDPENLPAKIEVAAEKAADSAEAFFGTWKCVYVEQNGSIVDLALVDVYFPDITIADGSLTFVPASEDDEMAAMYNMLGVIPAFEDGMLKLASTIPDAGIDGYVRLLEDGMIRMSLGSTEEAVVFYYAPAAAAEAPAA